MFGLKFRYKNYVTIIDANIIGRTRKRAFESLIELIIHMDQSIVYSFYLDKKLFHKKAKLFFETSKIFFC